MGTNISAARILLKEWVEKVGKGDVAVGHDPSQLHYADLRALQNDYAEQGHKSLRTNVETGEDYVCGLKHLDIFMSYTQDGDEGKVSAIGPAIRDAFVAQRQADGVANGTINRSLAALPNLVRAGVPRGVAMKISGHKTEDVFERYNITSSSDTQDAGDSVTEYLRKQRETAAQIKPEAKLQIVNS
jgi:hypothetical protein